MNDETRSPAANPFDRVVDDDNSVVQKILDNSGDARLVAARCRIFGESDQPEMHLVLARRITDETGKVIGQAGFLVNVEHDPELTGTSGVIAEIPIPQTPLAEQSGESPAAEWTLTQLPGANFVCVADALIHISWLSGAGMISGHMTGYEPSDFLGDSKYAAAWSIYPDDVDFIDNVFERLANDPGKTALFRYRIVSKDGAPTTVLECLRSFETNDGIRLCGWLVRVDDIDPLRGATTLFSFA